MVLSSIQTDDSTLPSAKRSWWVIHVKPRKEQFVAQQLERAGLECYVPLVRVNPKNPRAAKERPFFPNYIFIQATEEQLSHSLLRWTPGVRDVVSCDGRPTPVALSVIKLLRKRLARINARGGLNFDQLRSGDRVRVRSGPLAGLEGVFDTRLSGADRVQVLLSFLSQHPQRIRLHVDDIEKI